MYYISNDGFNDGYGQQLLRKLTCYLSVKSQNKSYIHVPFYWIGHPFGKNRETIMGKKLKERIFQMPVKNQKKFLPIFDKKIEDAKKLEDFLNIGKDEININEIDENKMILICYFLWSNLKNISI